MAKEKIEDDKIDNLETRLTRWLETQGYPLEMLVAQTFQQRGARVIQSDYYVDLKTAENREVDVVASWQRDLDDVIVRVCLMTECKESKDKPWILFVSEDVGLAGPARVVQRAASRLGRIALKNLGRKKKVQEISLFQLPPEPGYSITQAFTSGNDVCYAAASAVANASAARANEPDSQIGARGEVHFLEIIFPVVVTNSRLFAAKLEADGSISLQEIIEGVLVWRNPLLGAGHTIIHVVTSNALGDFASRAQASADQLLDMFAGEYRDAVTNALSVRQAS
ncbi:hypothetical protein LFL96_05035 [Paraburkholderia sp. D15]|uniref:hypothetical protein n=1 Tax=Paraburkholderia sp. D15 TaxID=2880218 RepID=UPI00247866F8|nr:hypothetical protein [Paraburkholderia sp. D15]WGS50871.1 hypothetical protein LFL96_05035 [Paraburkholderia sp. D15]